MDMLAFSDFDSIILPIGAFAILLAVYEFGAPHAQYRILETFFGKTGTWIISMIIKAYAFFGYLAFGLMSLVGIWVVAGFVTTLVQFHFYNVALPLPIVIFCWLGGVLAMSIPILMFIASKRRKKIASIPSAGDNVALDSSEYPTNSFLDTLEQNNKIIEQNNKIIEQNDKIITKLIEQLEMKNRNGRR